MTFDSFVFSSIGGREENQDAVGKLESEDGALYVVADGLGGHQFGSLAAEQAVSVLLDDWDATQAGEDGGLSERIQRANDEILEIQHSKNCITKTTVVALALFRGKAAWANTGDSRLYYIHNRQIEGYTEDHSVAYKKYKAGSITRAGIAQDEDQSCLLKALGGESRWEPDLTMLDEVSPGDAFMLCSDGMWEHILDEEILIDYLKSESAEKWAKLMLLRAIDRIEPGNDNLSLITVMVG